MVNLGLSKVDDAVAAKHPGLQKYAACQSHAFMKGAGTILLGGTALIAIQTLLRKRLPYAFHWSLFISAIGSSLASYAVTRWETQKCQDLWLLLETGKIPDRSPPQEPKSEEPTSPKKTKYGDVIE